MKGNILCLLALTFTIPMVLYLFSKLPPYKAAAIALLGSLLFLPMDKLAVPIILYDKVTATGIGLIMGMVAMDGERLAQYPWSIMDLPLFLWLLSGFLASVTNGLGAKDGIQEAFNAFSIWGAPFMAGRLYFSSSKAQSWLCGLFFLSGLVYIPFVAFELVMSPQAHRIVYGYMQHDFSQVIRGGGYRPMVFMQHGILLGTFMCMSALVGIWCTWTKVFPQKMWRAGGPMWGWALMLAGSAVACKSSAAIGLMVMGGFLLFSAVILRTRILIVCLFLVPLLYVTTRTSGTWDGQNLVDFVAEKFSEDRSLSLKFRLDNELILIDKAMERPIFGWGGWGRSRVFDEETGEDLSTTDGFWIITLGRWGILGLSSVFALILLPTVRFLILFPPRRWKDPEVAPGAVLALIPLLFIVDCTLNAMVNPAYILFAGGVAGLPRTSRGAIKQPSADHGNTQQAGKRSVNFADWGINTLPKSRRPRLTISANYSGPRFDISSKDQDSIKFH
ncbi:hypothetical protein [Desulfobacter vibrioformis]|uniref:hypothetical protein n=1 Tax=Desulfobacter vibrioformis TaxID=34031 RepID=UPI000691DBE5|nr:hypothetical protein [Desulfobacter vibrioformis]